MKLGASVSREIDKALRIRRFGFYLLPGGETRPGPVTPSFDARSKEPSEVDQENARRFLEFKLGAFS
jgi:hypothetical protein